MGLNARTAVGSGNRTPPLDPGTYPGRLVQVVDLGLQQQEYKGEKKDPRQMMMLTYELADEFMTDEDGQEQPDKPRWVSETMPLHNIEVERAKSTKRIIAMDPQGKAEGDFTKLIGTPVSVTLTQNPGKGDKVYVNVASVSAMRPKDAEKLNPMVHRGRVFLVDEPDMEVFNQLPPWTREKITKNLEFAGSVLEKAMEGMKDKSPVKEETPVEESPY